MAQGFTPAGVAAILRGTRYPVTTELALQDAIETRLRDLQVPFEREARLGPADRIDFLVDGDIGLEAKTKYARRSIYRQLERYCTNHQLRGMVLVTGTFLGLPDAINGVPVYMVSTGRAAL